jgi:gluconolactonase
VIALVIQDMQNDAVGREGAFATSGGADYCERHGVVERIAGLAAAFRAAGRPVIHVWYVVEEGAPELRQNAPLFESIRAAGANVRGSWGAAPVAGLEPQPGDYVVEKLRMNAFHDTRLDTLLRGLEVETLVVTGAWTNMSVEHTARHAADAGYRVAVASDGTATMSEEWQHAALGYALTQVATIATCAELEELLRSD